VQKAIDRTSHKYECLTTRSKLQLALGNILLKKGVHRKALDAYVNGIGADCLCIENYQQASRVSRTLRLTALNTFLSCFLAIVVFGATQVDPPRLDAFYGNTKSVLFGALAEVV
jgi:hypothetical protein